MIVDYKDYGLKYCRQNKLSIMFRIVSWLLKKKVNALSAYIWFVLAFLSISFNYYLLDQLIK